MNSFIYEQRLPNLYLRAKKLTKGLMYQSESDYPVKPFFLKNDRKKSLKASDIPITKKPVRQTDFDEFFDNATKEEDWYGPAELKTAKRFQYLVKFLRDKLTDIKVYKSGKVNMDVYVAGKTVEAASRESPLK